MSHIFSNSQLSNSRLGFSAHINQSGNFVHFIFKKDLSEILILAGKLEKKVFHHIMLEYFYE